MTSIETRLATTSDAPIIAAMLDDFNKEFEEESPGVVFLHHRLETLLTQPSMFIVVPTNQQVAFGLVTLRPNVWSDGFIAVLDELYTKPDHRSSGFGTALLHAAMAEAYRRGATDFAIEVDESDIDAYRFYARHGFPLRDPSTNECAYMLWRDLSTIEW